MIVPVGYRLMAGPEFDLDYRRIDAAASRNPSGPEAVLRREVLRTMLDLANGKSDGHHALGYEPGKGDLRDCVTAYVRSDPGRSADYRLVFRELGPAAPGELARRELVAIKPRHGRNDVYTHVCARLDRHPYDRQPELNRFDLRADVNGSRMTRQAELDAKRAIAYAWAGQQPLRSARPLTIGVSSDPRDVPHAAAAEHRYDGQLGVVSVNAERAQTPTGDPRPKHARSSPTGWPSRSK